LQKGDGENLAMPMNRDIPNNRNRPSEMEKPVSRKIDMKNAVFDGVSHFRIDQGETWIQPLQWVNADGSPKDISDYTFRWQIRKSATDSTIIATGSYKIIDAKQGMFYLKLTEEQTRAIPTKGKEYSQLSKYVYDVEVLSSDGTFVKRLLNGFILVSPEVTK
jgi:hypothetical protein